MRNIKFLSKTHIKKKYYELLAFLKFYNLICNIFIKNLSFSSSSRKYNALCIGRSIFNEDINSLSENSKSINFYIIDKSFFLLFFFYFLRDMPSHQIHIHYHQYTQFNKSKKNYYNFLDNLFNKIFKKINFHILISANYNYAWQQELAKMALKRKIPFVVLLKEFISPINDIDQNIERYTNNFFIGSKLLVYNDNIKKSFLKKKINGIEENKIISVGIPRFDKYQNIKQDKPENNLLFFSFDINDKTRHLKLSNKDKKIIFSQAYNFHMEIFKFVKENKNFNVTIKTKSNSRYLKQVLEYARETDTASCNNLNITNSKNIYELIQNSSIVICFNSTTIFEGLLSKRVILTPDIGRGIINNLSDGFHSSANLVKDSNDIKKIINNFDQSKLEFSDNAKILLKNYIHFFDYSSSSFTNKILTKEIEKKFSNTYEYIN